MLTSVQSPQVKLVRALKTTKGRQERGRFLIEGLRLVGEALTAGAHIETLYLCAELLPKRYVPNWVTEGPPGVVVREVSERVMRAMADTESPQGVVAVLPIPDCVRPQTRMSLVLVAHEVRDPGNLGTMIRTADAAGADAVIVSGDSVDIWNPKVLRATMGSVFHLPVWAEADLASGAQWLRQQGITVIAAATRQGISCLEANLRRPVAIVMGGEAEGLSDEDIQLADELVRIPMPGRAESLNVATAAAVLLFEAVRQRGCEV